VINMTIQEKILEAKKLLEQYAPKGEFLAYINRDEAKTLKELGGSGIIIEETGIPSFFPWLALAIAGSTAISYMGSLQTSKQLKAGAAWDKYYKNMEKMQNTIFANKKARKLISEKRAAIGARGVGFTGSTLLEQNSVVEDLEDTMFWLEKGVQMDFAMIDIKLAGALQSEAYQRNVSLLSGMGQGYTAYDESR
jgi:hypothetical protein